MVATGDVASRPAMRMRSQLSDEEICSGMRDRGRCSCIADGDECPGRKLLGGSVETDVEIEAGDGDGLAIGVFNDEASEVAQRAWRRHRWC